MNLNVNLVQETLLELLNNGKSPKDVRWVGSADGKYLIPWNRFESRFKNVKYFSGYGSQEIAKDLVVVGDNWWLSRIEYDGAEEWQFNTRPHKQKKTYTFESVEGWFESLEEINKKEKEEK